MIGISSCREGKINSVESNDFRIRLIDEYREASQEMNLGWNIPYRKALVLANRPMGCVFEYGISFSEFDQDISETMLWVHLGIIFPEYVVKEKQIQLYLDGKSFSMSKYDILRDVSDDEIGAEVDVYFKIPLEGFIASKRVSVSIGSEKDLLIADKRTLNEKISSWHNKITNGEMKDEDAILICPVRF